MKQVYVQTDMDEKVPLSYDYDLVEDGKVSTLKYSGSGNWGDQLLGETAGTIQDTGDEVYIKINGVKVITLDYLQANQLLILLLSNNKERLEIRECNLITRI